MASKTLLLLTVLFILNSGYGHAQSLNDHNSVFIDATTGVSIAGNSFTREFTPTHAIGLNVRLPFLKGQLEGGLRYTLYNGHAPTSVSSDFHTEFIYTGWSYPVNITSWYQIGPELRFGATRFSYNQSKVYRNGPFRFVTDPIDIEFSYELALRNQFRLSNHWSIHATLLYNHTYTRHPLPVTMVSGGISYAFTEPQWLKTFIK